MLKKMAVTFVTGNKNKLAEVQAILADVLPNLKSQDLDCKYCLHIYLNK
jgi:inosine/xanthosine triphosphate pyrophosphatase family protein